MKNLLRYKSFLGTAEMSEEDDVFFGKLIGISDLVSYEGATVKELKKGFKEAVDHYLDLCKRQNKPIQKSLSGNFNIRINPELHQLVSRAAAEKGVSLNKVVQEAIQSYVQEEAPSYKTKFKKGRKSKSVSK
jgi:predicted HicB family RNase H-like nuclease